MVMQSHVEWQQALALHMKQFEAETGAMFTTVFAQAESNMFNLHAEYEVKGIMLMLSLKDKYATSNP